MHAGYDPRGSDHDIAVVVLPTPLTYNDYVQPVCIPSAPVADNTQCVVTGWGATQGMPIYNKIYVLWNAGICDIAEIQLRAVL